MSAPLGHGTYKEGNDSTAAGLAKPAAKRELIIMSCYATPSRIDLHMYFIIPSNLAITVDRPAPA